MGEVYRARDTTLNRGVAIKVLLSAVANDPDLVEGKVALRDDDQIHVGPVLVIYHASASGITTETVVGPRPRNVT
jgi:hypothetical protein